jgi:uncharacterized protein
MPRSPAPGRPPARRINKLVLVVAEPCNLRCRYCYAHPRTHGRGVAKVMDPENARDAIRRFLGGREECTLIQFFGGEPTLNLRAIAAAIDEAHALVEEGLLGALPRFAIVTNGVFQDPQRTLDLLARHRIETTVSLDGPEALHDSLRPDAGGAPTFARAVRNTRTLLQAGLPVAVESVYTSAHVRAGFSVVDLFRFCQHIGAPRLIFDVAYPPAAADLNPLLDPYFERTLKYFCDAVDWWCESLLAGRERPLRVYFQDLLRPLLDGIPAVRFAGTCAAANEDFAIGPDGELYACQLLYGEPDFALGNVLSGEYPGLPSPFPVGAEDIAQCRECFARHWCQPCAALNRQWGDAWRPPERECERRRAVLHRIAWWAFERLTVPDNHVTSPLREVVMGSRGTRA